MSFKRAMTASTSGEFAARLHSFDLRSPVEQALADGRGVAGQYQSGESHLVNPCQIQRLQAAGHGPASQSLRWLQAGSMPLLQMFSQGRCITLRQPGQLGFHSLCRIG